MVAFALIARRIRPRRCAALCKPLATEGAIGYLGDWMRQPFARAINRIPL
ncbi:MAG: hypothetical protein O2975_05860 [Proteobacteria bacterium]|nr:hypothetical protein [Pseudomonadota bacterium]